MFHIVFDARAAELIQTAMDLDESLDGETIIFRDDYSIGPVLNLDLEDGLEERKKWWDLAEVEGGSSTFSGKDDKAMLQTIRERMGEEEFDQIWIWLAPNSRDLCGYHWLITQVKDFAGRVFVLSLNNLPFINEKGQVFYPSFLSEIPAREFTKAKKLARTVSSAEFETDPDEWLRLAAENKNLRLLEGGKKIVSHPDFYFDKALLNFVQPVFQKIQKTIQQFLIKSAEKTNDLFLAWRIKSLVGSNAVEKQGETIRLPIKATDEVGG